MNPQGSTSSDPVRPELLAEAGVWVARLHGDARSRAVETGFRQWLQADPEHRRAFELATEVWEASLHLRSRVPLPRPRRTARALFASTALAAVAVLIAVAIAYFRAGGVATGVGEQRLLTLEDGTRIFLNTATRVTVRYSQQARRVELETGEALFSVAKRADRPFIVIAGDQQVRALGTSFVVRRDARLLAVTLVEGKVTVTPNERARQAREPGVANSPTAAKESAPREPAGTDVPAGPDAVTLYPGQRLTFGAGAAPRLDRPSLDQAVAWRRGQVIFDDVPLSAAALEMNRYNNVQLIIEQPQAQGLLINGLFQAGDSASFAHAVAQTYGLSVEEQDERIILAGTPASAHSGAPSL